MPWADISVMISSGLMDTFRRLPVEGLRPVALGAPASRPDGERPQWDIRARLPARLGSTLGARPFHPARHPAVQNRLILPTHNPLSRASSLGNPLRTVHNQTRASRRRVLHLLHRRAAGEMREGPSPSPRECLASDLRVRRGYSQLSAKFTSRTERVVASWISRCVVFQAAHWRPVLSRLAAGPAAAARSWLHGFQFRRR